METTWMKVADLQVGWVVHEVNRVHKGEHWDWPATVTNITPRYEGKLRVSFDNGRRHEWGDHRDVLVSRPVGIMAALLGR
jgi:hypothetical protein